LTFGWELCSSPLLRYIIYLIIIVVLIEGGGIVDNPRFIGRIPRKILIKIREKKRWISGGFLVDRIVERMWICGKRGNSFQRESV
jgi:hypothetical protein